MGRRKGSKNKTAAEKDADATSEETLEETSDAENSAGKRGRPEGSTNLTFAETKTLADKHREECEAQLTYTKKHIADELSFFELYNGYFEKNIKYYPFKISFYATGGIVFVIVIVKFGQSREYASSMNAKCWGLVNKSLDEVPEHLMEIMRHNREVMECEWNEKEPKFKPVPKIEPSYFPKCHKKDDEVYDRDENGKRFIRKKIKSPGRIVSTERKKFINKLKEAKKNTAPDEIVEEVDGEIIVRKKKKRGRATTPERQKEIAALKKAQKKCKKDEVAEIINGKVVIRKKKPRGRGLGRPTTPERKKLLEALAKAKKKCKKTEMAEIVDGKVRIRKKKPRGKQVGWKSHQETV